MDSSHTHQQAAGRTGVPAALDGEIFPPKGRARPADKAVEAEPAKAPARAQQRWIANLLIGTTMAGLFGLGAAGGFYFWDRARALNSTVASLHQVQHELVALKGGMDGLKGNPEAARQDETIRTFKKSVDSLKAELESARAATSTATAQLAAKIDKSDRDPAAAKLADLSARIDKLDNPAAKLGDITARLDRIERQVSSPTPTGSIAAASKTASPAPAAAQQAVAASVDKVAPKPAALPNYVLRDVYDGIALVEGRGGAIREVTPGEFLPGAGEVRAIERRGRAWVVVTSRGVIDDTTF